MVVVIGLVVLLASVLPGRVPVIEKGRRFGQSKVLARRAPLAFPLACGPWPRYLARMDSLVAAARNAKAWPFQEALRLAKRFEKKPPGKRPVVFETGFGASGLPHIGTFGEVVRTTMVRHAFEFLTGLPTKLICFSDDLDGLRKVPDNIPNREMVRAHIGKPLTAIPDPYGKAASFGAYNNARFRHFLDAFGFECEFLSSTQCYRSGRFDPVLRVILEHYEDVRSVILPSLGEERRKTYSPFLPISPTSGRVLQVPLKRLDAKAGTITFDDENGAETTLPVTGGHCKLQWKVDWAMRWVALGVDYEMAGKDLIESVRLSGAIARRLGGRPPEGFIYELFLDENGEKISKSKGNGLSLEEWLTYASTESLALFMYQNPTRAKRLFFDIIPKTVDDYTALLEAYPGQSPAERVENPVFHIHGGKVPKTSAPVSFSLLLNLVSTAQSDDKAFLWRFVTRYAGGATAKTHPELDRLLDYAIRYYDDFVLPTKKLRAPAAAEKKALTDLLAVLEKLPAAASAEEIQTEIYEVGKRQGYVNLRDWFKALYEIFLGQPQGPRMGSFIKLFGKDEMAALIRKTLA
jgi:lysyl-tRNA synthetase, class I